MNQPRSDVPAPLLVDDRVADAQLTHRRGQAREALTQVGLIEAATLSLASRIHLLKIEGEALFDVGEVSRSICTLKRALDLSCDGPDNLRFDIVFSLLLRSTDFYGPADVVPQVAELRQLGSRIGDAYALSLLHLAVARLEGIRGHYLDAHRRLQTARQLAVAKPTDSLLCSLDMVDGSLECSSGHLGRSTELADRCLRRAESAGLSKYVLGSYGNLAIVALYSGRPNAARQYLERVLPMTAELTYVQLGVLDSLVQVNLHDGRLDDCRIDLEQYGTTIRTNSLPSRSWYDLAHDVTRCAFYERLGEWEQIVTICEPSERECARRQYKAIRTSLICASARALARLGEHDAAPSRALAVAVRVCPRGAVDPLIVLEASKALRLSVRGQTAGAVHFDRALAACRAIGHRYHEAGSRRTQDEVAGASRGRAQTRADRTPAGRHGAPRHGHRDHPRRRPFHRPHRPPHRRAPPGHAPRPARRTSATNPAANTVADPTASCDTDADGTFTLRLQGSDRRVTIAVRRRRGHRRDLAAEERAGCRAGRHEPHRRNRGRRRRPDPLATRGRRERRRHRVPIPAHDRTAPHRRPAGHRAPAHFDHGRNRHWQGNLRAAHPRLQSGEKRPVRSLQLLGHAARAGRKPALRSSPRRLHRRGRCVPGRDPLGRTRHALSRRTRRPGPLGPAETAPLPREQRDSSGRRYPPQSS